MPDNVPQKEQGESERLWDHERRLRRVEEYTRAHESEHAEKWLNQNRFNDRIEEAVDAMEKTLQKSREAFIVEVARAKLLVTLAILLGNGVAIAILGIMIQRLAN